LKKPQIPKPGSVVKKIKMSEMKLLMENWRGYVSSAEDTEFEEILEYFSRCCATSQNGILQEGKVSDIKRGIQALAQKYGKESIGITLAAVIALGAVGTPLAMILDQSTDMDLPASAQQLSKEQAKEIIKDPEQRAREIQQIIQGEWGSQDEFTPADVGTYAIPDSGETVESIAKKLVTNLPNLSAENMEKAGFSEIQISTVLEIAKHIDADNIVVPTAGETPSANLDIGKIIVDPDYYHQQGLTDDEAAISLAHELAHLLLDHAAERLKAIEDTLNGAGYDSEGKLPPKVCRALLRDLGGGASDCYGVDLSFVGPDIEHQADVLSVLIATAAGIENALEKGQQMIRRVHKQLGLGPMDTEEKLHGKRTRPKQTTDHPPPVSRYDVDRLRERKK